MPRARSGRQQHGGDPPGQRGGRQRVPRLHLGGGLRDHPGGRRRADAVGCVGGVARPVRDGGQEGQGRQRFRAAGVAHHHGGAGHRWRCCWASCSRSRTSPSWCRLAFAIAASANFPVLFMSVLWKDCTTRGAVIGGFLGLISSVLLTVVSPSVWEATLGYPKGSRVVPVRLAGAVLDDHRLRRASGCSRSSTEAAARGKGPRRLPGAASAVGDRHRRNDRIQALNLARNIHEGLLRKRADATGTRRRETLRHTHAVRRRAERRDCLS